MITNIKIKKILEFYKRNPNKCYGAMKIDIALDFHDSIAKKAGLHTDFY